MDEKEHSDKQSAVEVEEGREDEERAGDEEEEVSLEGEEEQEETGDGADDDGEAKQVDAAADDAGEQDNDDGDGDDHEDAHEEGGGGEEEGVELEEQQQMVAQVSNDASGNTDAPDQQNEVEGDDADHHARQEEEAQPSEQAEAQAAPPASPPPSKTAREATVTVNPEPEVVVDDVDLKEQSTDDTDKQDADEASGTGTNQIMMEEGTSDDFLEAMATESRARARSILEPSSAPIAEAAAKNLALDDDAPDDDDYQALPATAQAPAGLGELSRQHSELDSTAAKAAAPHAAETHAPPTKDDQTHLDVEEVPVTPLSPTAPALQSLAAIEAAWIIPPDVQRVLDQRRETGAEGADVSVVSYGSPGIALEAVSKQRPLPRFLAPAFACSCVNNSRCLQAQEDPLQAYARRHGVESLRRRSTKEALDRLFGLLHTCNQLVAKFNTATTNHDKGTKDGDGAHGDDGGDDELKGMGKEAVQIWRGRQHQVLLAIGNAFCALKDYRLAARVYERMVLPTTPHDTRLLSLLGRIALLAGDVTAAHRKFARVEELIGDSSSPQVMCNAAFLELAKGDTTKAADLFAAAQKATDGNDSTLATNWAVMKLYSGDLSMAIRATEASMSQLASLDETLIFNLTSMYELQSGFDGRHKKECIPRVLECVHDGFNVAALKLRDL
ncbi:hypothetical protein PTSG_03432 [Salpingoeca rosetta]|uniref:Uncharacterized protein n=1 Tax=Salpingoeca rosetta (strain ATCC 50818 / BSB-021) TaxID=946362 RepID=F2U566_SALR5|nr:uncharacterized protein PTSG_03432 [Salpingoeca rosetta]EGD82782.1 hypothetical protein PTSG_03432 [Salpingoeca rosetta]|eukprot:XP_004996018.1 hypothetical protein PTSG_03432 [Salpingoeca rosetta]